MFSFSGAFLFDFMMKPFVDQHMIKHVFEDVFLLDTFPTSISNNMVYTFS